MNSRAEVIENGYIEITDGKIKKIAEGIPAGIDIDDFNGDGNLVYPGFIDAHTHLGLSGNGVGIEGEDLNEDSDPITPQIRVIDGINPLDRSFFEARAAGVTTVAVSPGSTNPVAGEIVCVKTAGKRIDKMIVKTVGMKLSLGENPKMTYLDKDNTPVTRMATAALIREALSKAKRYMEDKEKASNDSELDPPDYDIKNESLIPLLSGELKAHFHCHRADDIFTALRLSKEFNLDCVLVHCTEGHLIADELAEEKAAAIVGPIISDRSKPELANLTTKNAGILNNSGVKTAVCTDHSEVPVQYLPLSAAIAVKNGLDKESGIRSITSEAADILGVSDRVGSIEEGLDADLVMLNGEPLDLYSTVLKVWINGSKVYDISERNHKHERNKRGED